MKVLIVGLGSIARKHLAALRELQPGAEVYALRSGLGSDIENVINIKSFTEIPTDLDFALVSNPTSEHLKTIKKLVNLQIPLFIEKPPFMDMDGVDEILQVIRNAGIRTYTAFNFRFHPVVKWLKENLSNKKVIEVQAYCGSYLPEWRPSRDYRNVYSAIAELGGGVHLDLIHEMDYLVWIFGNPDEVNSFKRRVSDLEINSFDVAHYWMNYKDFNVSVLLNYYRRDPKRQIEIVHKDGTWTADLLKGLVVDSDNKVLFESQSPVIDTYKFQMQYFLDGLSSEEDYMNNLHESVNILKYTLS